MYWVFHTCSAYHIFQVGKGPTISCSENKDADLSVARLPRTVTAQLICIFVFVHTKCRFSHDAAHIRVIEKLWVVSLILSLLFNVI